MQILKRPAGAYGSWTVTLQDDQGRAVTTYTGSETVTAQVWGGDSLAPLFSPTVAWVSAAAGTISLVVQGSDTSALATGNYRLEISLTSSGVTFPVYEAVLALTASPGTGTVPASYCSYDDMLRFAPWVGQLADEEAGQAGFAEQRGRARSRIDDLLIDLWKPNGFYLLGDPGYTAANLYGYGNYPSKWLRDQLDANLLVVRDRVKEIAAKLAIAYVCDSQLGAVQETPFESLARRFRSEADVLIKTCRFEIDLNADGYADVVISGSWNSVR